MSVIGTNVIIERLKKNEEIYESITEVSLVEYPPVLEYQKFFGKVLVIDRKDILLSLELQRRLRATGKNPNLLQTS